MKILIYLALFFVAFFGAITQAEAADRYWVGGTDNWNGTAGTKWATTSGGAGGSAVPTASDDVYFDANSTGTVTVAASALANNVDFTGFTQTFAGSSALAISGSSTFSAGMTNTYSGTVTFNATSGTKTITSNGKVFLGPVTFNGVGGTWQLGDDLAATSTVTITLTNGTVNANNYNVTTGLFSSSNANARVINMGTGTWTLIGTGTVWNMATVTNATLNPSSSTIKLTNSTSTSKTFSGGGLTYNNLWFSGTGTGDFILIGSNTFADLKADNPPHRIQFTSNTTTTVSSFTVSGSAGNYMILQSTTDGGVYSLVKTGDGAVTADYLILANSRAFPDSVWDPGANSINVYSNTGWIFPAYPTGGTANNFQQLWVAAGIGTNNTLAYSYDGLSWIGLGTSTFSVSAQATAYNGSRWIATGEGGNSLAYSDDGITWTGLGTSIFSTRGYGIAWTGNRWVAGGSGTNTLAYSDDGITWTGLGATVFSTRVWGITCNGTTMCTALGQGTNSIAYSTDNGLTWTGVGTDIFSLGVRSAFNGSRWVAGGVGTSTLAYSDDGITWTGLGATVFSALGMDIVWDGSRFVATGGQNINSFAYSTDGITWTGMGSQYPNLTTGRGMAYDGTKFVTVGQRTGVGNNMAYSTDGIIWFGLQKSVFSSQGEGITSSVAPYLYPARLLSHRLPTTTGLSTTTAVFGDPGFTLTVSGTNFDASSTIQWNGDALSTTFVTSTTLTASVPSSKLLISGPVNVTVVAPTPGGGTSNAQVFTVQLLASVGVGGSVAGGSGSVSITPPISHTISTPVSEDDITATMRARIIELMGIIASLQQQIALQHAAGGTGFQFNRDLILGMSNNDVRELQKYLNKQGFIVSESGPGSPDNETTVFGNATKAALIKFQDKHAAEILTPIGLTKGSGIFGPATRAYVNKYQ